MISLYVVYTEINKGTDNVQWKHPQTVATKLRLPRGKEMRGSNELWWNDIGILLVGMFLVKLYL